MKECAERAASDETDIAVPLGLYDYDRVAGRLSAALMLRDTPITGREATEIAGLVSGLLRHSFKNNGPDPRLRHRNIG